MKRFTLLLSLVGAMCFADVQAQTTGLIGYTNGNHNRSSTTCRVDTTRKQGLAIKLGKEKVALLKGTQITGISAAFGTRQVEGLTLFITDSLGGTPLYSEAATGAATKWVEFALTTPYTITGEEGDLYVGYTLITNTTTSKPLSFDFSDGTEGTSWVLTSEEWTDVYSLGFGCANLQLMVSGLPQLTDLHLKTFNVSGYYKAETPYQYSGQLFNFGTQTVTSFDITCQIGDGDPMTIPFTDQSIAPGETFDFTLPEYISPISGTTSIKLNVTGINGGLDNDTVDNSRTCEAFFYPAGMERNILLEGFTGQSCSNCPEGHRTIARTLESIETPVIEVMHHYGYQPDIFTMVEDYNSCWYFNSGGSIYAPAVMLNRVYNPSAVTGSNTIAPGPVHAVSEENILGTVSLIDKMQPYVSISLLSSYDPETREVEVTMQILPHTDLPTDSTVLNIYLTQDSIIAYQALGGTDYVHSHALRKVITGNSFGVLINPQPGSITEYKKTFTLEEEIVSDFWLIDGMLEEAGAGKTLADVTIPTVLENMHLVAYVGAYDSKNPNANPVYNCVSTQVGKDHLAPTVTGIRQVEPMGQAVTVYVKDGQVEINGSYEAWQLYDLTGTLLFSGTDVAECPRMEKGIYLVRVACQGRTETFKLVVGN